MKFMMEAASFLSLPAERQARRPYRMMLNFGKLCGRISDEEKTRIRKRQRGRKTDMADIIEIDRF